LKIELHKALQSLFQSRKSITARKLEHLITSDSLIKMEGFEDFYVHINLAKESISNFYLKIK